MYKERAKKSKFERAQKVAAIVALGATAFGLGGCFQDKAGAQAPESQASGVVEAPLESGAQDEPLMSGDVDSESPQSNAPEQEVSVEDLRISAELPPEEIAQELQDLQVKWGFAGATSTDVIRTKEAWYAWNGDADSFDAQMSEENASIYAPALLGEDWQNDETRIRKREAMIEWNAKKIASALGNESRNEPIPELKWSVSDVKEYNSVDDVVKLGDFRYVDNTREELSQSEARFIEYTTTPEWVNNQDGDYEVSRVGMALRVEDDGTLTLIEESTSRIR